MKIQERPFITTLPISSERANMAHVSEIIRHVAIETGILKNADEAPEDFDVEKMALGMAMEDWMMKHWFPDVNHQPGEMILNGIAMNPDGAVWTKNGKDKLVLVEVKVTWKSSKRPIEDQWMWLTQIKAYCHALGTRYARLIVFYVNGDYDYSKRRQRRLYVYDMEFTDQELLENWNLITNWKGKL